MTTDVEADDIEITRGQRLLAVVLAIFLLVGSLWAYAHLQRHDGLQVYNNLPRLSASERHALHHADQAGSRANAAAGRAWIAVRPTAPHWTPGLTSRKAGGPTGNTAITS